MNDIETLTQERGYIYAILMIIFEDFHVDVLHANKMNYRERLSTKEAALILGYLVKRNIDWTHPEAPEKLLEMKKQTYSLFEELHRTFHKPFVEKMVEAMKRQQNGEEAAFGTSEKDFFGDPDLMVEPIFYSGTGAYDVQYRDLIAQRYRYDAEWLKEKYGYDVQKVGSLLDETKALLQKKSEKVNLHFARDRKHELFADSKPEDMSDEDWTEEVDKQLSVLEMFQYIELFGEGLSEEYLKEGFDLREQSWNSFYSNLPKLHIISPDEYSNPSEARKFLDSFSLKCGEVNQNFSPLSPSIDAFNEVAAKPIIKLNDNEYLLTNSFMLYESVYESPFYWMFKDKEYEKIAKGHRGKTGEEIVSSMLSQVFGETNTYKVSKSRE